MLAAPFWGARGAVWARDDAGEGTSLPLAVNPPLSARVGAARPLRLIDFEGRPLQGVLSEPKWETRGNGLFFTRDFGGTRNIWRAFPDARDASRYPRWRALPVTRFVAPLFATGAVPLEGDRSLLMLSNVTNPRLRPQVTLFTLIEPAFRALTAELGGVYSVAPAPGGKSFAYVTPRLPAEAPATPAITAERPLSIWKGSLVDASPPEFVASGAWNPVWQGEDALLVEKVGNAMISRLSIDEAGRAGRATGIAAGSQVSASRDGSVLVVVGKAGQAPLYLLSGDGSGLLALGGTEGAHSPALSGDGRWLAFTAPLESEVGRREGRGLWILRLQNLPTSESAPSPSFVEGLPVEALPFPQNPREKQPVGVQVNAVKARPRAPIAQIRAVQNAPRGALAIWGTASGPGASATLEIGQGARPNRWEARPLTLPIAPDAPLLLWKPPASARGVWNFRLTVSGPGGAAQSLFTVQLPLAPRVAKPAPAPAPVGGMPAGGPLPIAPLPDLPAPPQPSAPVLPPLSPAPPVRENPSGAQSGFPVQSAPAPSRALPSPSPNFAPAPGRDAASFNISNTLAQMKAGQSVTVTFWVHNKGTRAWDIGGNTMQPGTVRLVTRWIRFDNGNRNGWTYQTMKTPVSPDARTRWDFKLVAPTQPGRYKLIYALQRVAPGWSPPAYDAAQETWPDDFAAIAFAVTVKPG